MKARPTSPSSAHLTTAGTRIPPSKRTWTFAPGVEVGDAGRPSRRLRRCCGARSSSASRRQAASACDPLLTSAESGAGRRSPERYGHAAVAATASWRYGLGKRNRRPAEAAFRADPTDIPLRPAAAGAVIGFIGAIDDVMPALARVPPRTKAQRVRKRERPTCIELQLAEVERPLGKIAWRDCRVVTGSGRDCAELGRQQRSGQRIARRQGRALPILAWLRPYASLSA